jgi:hypothetical protein
MFISVSANNNLLKIAKYMNQTLKGLSLSIDEANNYIKLGKKIFPISFAANENEYDYIVLRTESGVLKLINQLYYFNHSIQNFKISNGLLKWEIKQYPENLKYIYDHGFRIFIREGYDGNYYNKYRNESVFYRGSGSSCFYSGNTLEPTTRYNCKPILNYLDLKIENPENPWAGKNKALMASALDPFQTFISFEPKTKLRIDGKNYVIDMEKIRKGALYLLTEDRTPWDERIGYSGEQDLNSLLKTYGIVNQFTFVSKLNNIINSQSGVIISFIGIKPKNEIVRFYYEDIKSLEEINKITEYKVIPNY